MSHRSPTADILHRSRLLPFRPLLLLTATCLLAACGMFDSTCSAAEKVFRAGAYAQDITPPEFPISMNGGMSDRQAKGANDPLHARCLVLDDGRNQVAIVVCDCCAIYREVFDEAKKLATEATGIPADHMLMSATHTHSAPTVVSAFQSDPDKNYQKFLAARIAQGIQKAVEQLVPAKIGWGVGKNSQQVFNRRWKMKPGKFAKSPFGGDELVKMNPGFLSPEIAEPAGPVDPDVSILAVQSRDGRPIGLLANYSLHYVGGTPPDVVSADYFAAFAERIGQLIGAGKGEPAFVGIMSNGTSGDINNNNYSQGAPDKQPPMGQIKLVADSVARTALAAYKEIVYHDYVPLVMREKEIELGVRRPTEDELLKATQILEAAKAPVLKTQPEVYARETVLLHDYAAKVKIKLQGLRIGDLGICAIPCETFVEIGLAIKKQSPMKPTFTIELANGYNGYLPTPEQHKLGGYETWRARSSYLEVDAATKIQATVLELLQAVAE